MSRERRDSQTPELLHCHDHGLASRPATPMDAPVDPTDLKRGATTWVIMSPNLAEEAVNAGYQPIN